MSPLQALMEGCGPACLPWMTNELRALILKSLLHQSRSPLHLLSARLLRRAPTPSR